MAADKKMPPRPSFRISRKEPLGMKELVELFIRSNGLAGGLNVKRIFTAWDEVSGASAYTLRKDFFNGVLHVTMSSSVVRSQLMPRREALVEAINNWLSLDNLYTRGTPDGSFVAPVKGILLK